MPPPTRGQIETWLETNLASYVRRAVDILDRKYQTIYLKGDQILLSVEEKTGPAGETYRIWSDVSIGQLTDHLLGCIDAGVITGLNRQQIIDCLSQDPTIAQWIIDNGL
jgi:hypothetical protein